jgi:hypothetical protein
MASVSIDIRHSRQLTLNRKAGTGELFKPNQLVQSRSQTVGKYFIIIQQPDAVKQTRIMGRSLFA